MKTWKYFALFALVVSSCSPRNAVMLDEITLATNRSGTRPIYRASEPLQVGTFHTELEIRVDWENEAIDGVARITCSPQFYPLEEITLDAVGMKIHSVQELKLGNKPEPLTFRYDGKELTVELGRQATSTDTLRLQIDYRALPSDLDAEGSAAIRDARGMYFVNASGRNPYKPTQLWTQGETEANSCWFPTFDQPNAKMTQEIYVYTDTSRETLSNGTLEFSQPLGNGLRLDYWRQNQPQAPYLTFLGIGEFSVTREDWNGKEVSYWVEPEYAPYAAKIFDRTPEMLTFFSEITGVDYPWDKYAQIVVRDFVSGAMENTTAVVFNESLHGDHRSFLGRKNDQIVAHEMFHHWFGDLVTCESWSNLTLNESFATYGEYLWWDYAYGRDEAAWILHQKKRSYLNTYHRGVREDIVRYDYDSREDMFDVHSYSKGGCVLHMLRGYLGDAAFFQGLNRYLETHAYGTAELADLRQAFEVVTGGDLNWFFNQWFLDDGHPILEVSYDWNAENQEITVRVQQVQNQAEHPLYDLPTTVDFYSGGRRVSHPIRLDEAENTFTFALPAEPDWMQLDGGHLLLAEIRENRPIETFWKQWEQGRYLMDRWTALEVLMQLDNPAAHDRWIEAALADPAPQIRKMALEKLEGWRSEKSDLWVETVFAMASGDANHDVRSKAIEVYNGRFDQFDSQLYFQWLNDSSYAVSAAALRAFASRDFDAAVQFGLARMDACGDALEDAIAEILSQLENDARSLDFFVPRLQRKGMGSFVRLGGVFVEYLKHQSPEIVETGAAVFRDQALEPRPEWVSFRAMAYLKELYQHTTDESLKRKIGLMVSEVERTRR